VPEDLADPEGSVDLWVASARAYYREEEIVVRGSVSVLTAVALERGGVGRTFPGGVLELGVLRARPGSRGW
jgi:hypothetical protein